MLFLAFFNQSIFSVIGESGSMSGGKCFEWGNENIFSQQPQQQNQEYGQVQI